MSPVVTAMRYHAVSGTWRPLLRDEESKAHQFWITQGPRLLSVADSRKEAETMARKIKAPA